MMRFDMRVPGKTPGEISDQYRTAIEMSQWADDKGCASIGVSEHHAAEDGYTASPLVLATAIAAVTKKVQIVVGGAIADAKLSRLLDVLQRASEALVMPRVTPPSFTRGRPAIAWGGATKAAARRAGRSGLGFFAQTNTPGLGEAYAAAAREAGFEPGTCIPPAPEMPGAVIVHPDPDQGWREVGPHLLQDAISYADWNKDAGRPTVRLSQGRTIEELRSERAAHRVVDDVMPLLAS